MSSFDAMWKTATRAIDTTFGDPFVFIPMAVLKGRPVPDATRPETPLVAAFMSHAEELDAEGKRVAANTVSPFSTETISIDFAADALPEAPRLGDRLQHVASGRLFEISSVRPDEVARITVGVFRKGSGQ
ncbi:MAG: hypothetical protein JWM36_3244 [Hyphomicrobiales bacterium]|nr:hypothetical protein [Hyphomicrobiales bacterium]